MASALTMTEEQVRALPTKRVIAVLRRVGRACSALQNIDDGWHTFTSVYGHYDDLVAQGCTTSWVLNRAREIRDMQKQFAMVKRICDERENVE